MMNLMEHHHHQNIKNKKEEVMVNLMDHQHPHNIKKRKEEDKEFLKGTTTTTQYKEYEGRGY